MIDVQQLSPGSNVLSLGETAKLRIRRRPGEGQASPAKHRLQIHVESNGIRHVQPFLERLDWDGLPFVFTFFPEAPGDHRLFVGVSEPGGEKQWTELAFKVGEVQGLDHEPHLADAGAGARLWTPSAWEVQGIASHEREMLAALPELVRPGNVVYDIGANLGLYSTRFSELAGPTGQVYCFEANPLCVYFLRANLSRLGGSPQIIFPMAVSDCRGRAGFAINYDNLNLGLSGDSAFFSQKAGHRIEVECYSIDDVVEDLELRLPDVIKVDIEGAEMAAVRGMRKTLERARPLLLIELHGREVAAATLALLDEMGYHYSDTEKDFMSSAEVMADMPEAPVQIVARA